MFFLYFIFLHRLLMENKESQETEFQSIMRQVPRKGGSNEGDTCQCHEKISAKCIPTYVKVK